MTSKLEYEEHEEYRNRSRKLKELRELGVEPYPHKYTPTHFSKRLHEQFENSNIGHSDDAAAGETESVRVSGRLILFRAMGKNAFAHIQDHMGKIQVMFNRDDTKVVGYDPNNTSLAEAPKPLKLIEKKIDLGDIIGIEGNLFHTQKGELTVYAKKVTLLCKTLLPLAEKHAGLHDKEIRYRKRWLDLISNEDVRETFRIRSQILSQIRKYFENLDFIEVETPVLQSIYGGAEARPFTTRLHALDQKMFMRISLEIPLKKLIVGGMDKVFEMGRVFRNEGIDRSHNPEFTLLEAYASYWDYNDMMQCMENLVEMLAMKLFGTTKLAVNVPDAEEPVEIDVKAPWPRLSMKESLKKFTNIDVDALSDEELYHMVIECGHLETKKVKTFPRGLMISALFEHKVEPLLIQPHHITDFPIETTPLCKPHRDPEEKSKGIVERFESFILGGEFCNAYSELNDPLIQKQLLEEQAKRKEAGDEEANPFDHEFVEAICQGMPPTGGIGIGIDRLVMLLTNSVSIRDVLFFPWMKPTS
ncbi:MAG: Lysine--tRNA ligase [Chlamydiae bacterium]|nr:Lysine--tRNA ligase [Chlamydiota bacterium]